MNRLRVKQYINEQPIKIVKELNLETKKIEYDKIIQHKKIKEIRGDEEIVRAYILTKLVNELGYDPNKIEIEVEYTAGRPHTLTSFIDIIVRDEENNAFLFIELKAPEDFNKIDQENIIEEQLFKVAGMERAEGRKVKYLVLYTINENMTEISDECIVIDSEKTPYYSEWKENRENVNMLPEKYGKLQKKPYKKASSKDLETNFTIDALSRLQSDLHNVLWGGGGTDDNEIFSSLVNLILAKIQDEDEKEDGDIYDFQSLTFQKDGDDIFETNEQLFDRINILYKKALKKKLNVVDENELNKSYVIDSKKFSLAKLKYTVQKLEGLSFIDGKNSLNGKDILGDFFEGIIRDGFKQTKGQFFTPINIVKFMLWGLQVDQLAIKKIKKDNEIPYMIDPSAGAGTFLIEYMKFITQNIKYKNNELYGYNKELGNSRAVYDKVHSDWFYPNNRENKWAQTFIYGVEINFNLGTATKVNMILHGDGSTNIFVKDGLLPFSEYTKESAPNALKLEIENELYKQQNKTVKINGNFDIILTNPPFNVALDNDTKKLVSKNFLFGDKKNSENLFIERWYQLLRENGRVAAVLPENIFDTAENKYIRLFLFKFFKIKAIISLPQVTFEPYTSTKTSIIFAQKKTKTEIEEWNSVWENCSKKYNKYATIIKNLISVNDGEKSKEKLPSIKDLNEKEMKEILIDFLKIGETAKEISIEELIKNYRTDLEGLCKKDKDTEKVFGFVNTWWVFDEITREIDYDIFMAEADTVGYKRTKRSEKVTANDLYRIDDHGLIKTDDGKEETILDYMRNIKWE